MKNKLKNQADNAITVLLPIPYEIVEKVQKGRFLRFRM